MHPSRPRLSSHLPLFLPIVVLLPSRPPVLTSVYFLVPSFLSAFPSSLSSLFFLPSLFSFRPSFPTFLLFPIVVLLPSRPRSPTFILFFYFPLSLSAHRRSPPFRPFFLPSLSSLFFPSSLSLFKLPSRAGSANDLERQSRPWLLVGPFPSQGPPKTRWTLRAEPQ